MTKLTAKQHFKARSHDMSEADKANFDAMMYGTGVLMIQSNGDRKHVPLEDIVLMKASQIKSTG